MKKGFLVFIACSSLAGKWLSTLPASEAHETAAVPAHTQTADIASNTAGQPAPPMTRIVTASISGEQSGGTTTTLLQPAPGGFASVSNEQSQAALSSVVAANQSIRLLSMPGVH